VDDIIPDADDMSDEQYVREVLGGNRERFGELYDVYAGRIYAYLWYRTGHRETAEDLTSTVFLKALDRLRQFTGGSFRAWLYTIARTTLIDHYRTQHPSEDLESVHISLAADQPGHADRKILLDRIRTAMQSLSPEQRNVVVLRVWDDLPHREIAQVLGLSEASVKMIFSRSIRRLKDAVAVASILLLIHFVHVLIS
jgi:RNA polymerase sigma-70 factor (ECF subfamily)